MEQVKVAKIALSAVTYAIDKPYDYLVPPELVDTLCPGMRVIVPFGAGNRRTEGIILSIEARDEACEKLKSVLILLDDTPVMDEEGLRLALWIREHWFCTVYDAARAMLPAGLYFSLQDRYKLPPNVSHESVYEAAGQSKVAKQVAELICACPQGVELGQLRAAFGTKDPGPALRLLIEQGVLVHETSISRGVGDKTEQIAYLSIPPEEAMALVTPKRRSAPLRYAVVETLCATGSAATKELCYFTGASTQTLRSLVKSGILELKKREVFRRVATAQVEPAEAVVLNIQQETAFQGLNQLAASGQPAVALLHGVTGSGKTLVYIRLIQESLARGQTAMVLVPEISLTPQLLHIFTSYFGDEIAVLHSSLRVGERYDEWKRVRAGKVRVVIGTRSAVFAPLSHLGLLILDEEQEYTYKSENTPRYHARDVAKYRSVQNSALLLLGSATPSVETMYLAKTGVYRLFTLTQRYNECALPAVHIADMKQELKAGNGTSISRPLKEALLENLRTGEQSILFLNRRGSSRMAVCGECGEVPTCPRCSVYLTYHSANGRLMCHYCGHSEPMLPTCTKCGGPLIFQGAGTQKIQEELKSLFPKDEVLRMDTDTITATQTHERLLSHFEQDRIPILVGTQMVAKGLDFENVTLVGVVDADLSLYVDDYRAGERTFSLITQVIGRAGRGAKKGRAVIQTFTPKNDIITFAAAQDYGRFYEEEIHFRALRGCPPFQDLFVITASGLDEEAVLRTCLRLRYNLQDWLQQPMYVSLGAQLLGPAPAAVAKVNKRYRYRLTLMCKNTKQVRKLVAHLLRCAVADKENRGVSVSADVNPL